jgi:hypothetical protein
MQMLNSIEKLLIYGAFYYGLDKHVSKNDWHRAPMTWAELEEPLQELDAKAKIIQNEVNENCR